MLGGSELNWLSAYFERRAREEMSARVLCALLTYAPFLFYLGARTPRLAKLMRLLGCS